MLQDLSLWTHVFNPCLRPPLSFWLACRRKCPAAYRLLLESNSENFSDSCSLHLTFRCGSQKRVIYTSSLVHVTIHFKFICVLQQKSSVRRPCIYVYHSVCRVFATAWRIPAKVEEDDAQVIGVLLLSRHWSPPCKFFSSHYSDGYEFPACFYHF